MRTAVTFALARCSVQVGTHTVTGFAPGDALTIEMPDQDFEKEDSSDGFVTFVQKHVSTADGVLRLGMGNALVAVMRALHAASLAAGGLTYQFSAINLKSPDERVMGKMLFKQQVPVKWGDTVNAAEIPFFLIPDGPIQGGTILPT